jgi:acetylornithine deacetylase/succinyl-diaminopimelate desuccinylase-like protein
MMAAGGQSLGIGGLLRNTMVVMMITGGFKANAMPTQAEALVNARLLPGTDIDAFFKTLAGVVGNPRVQFEIVSTLPQEEAKSYFAARTAIKASTLDTDLFRAIRSSAIRTWPDAVVLPTMLAAGTDATWWRQRGIAVYGIAPFPADAEGRAGVHGADERVPLAGIDTGSAFVFDLVNTVAAP